MSVNSDRQMGFPGKFQIDPAWVICKDFWSIIVMVRSIYGNYQVITLFSLQ